MASPPPMTNLRPMASLLPRPNLPPMPPGQPCLPASPHGRGRAQAGMPAHLDATGQE
jgi:hypothetical protein